MQCLHNLMRGTKKPAQGRQIRQGLLANLTLGEYLSAHDDSNKCQQENEHATGQWQQPWNDINDGFGSVDFAVLIVVVLGRVRHGYS